MIRYVSLHAIKRLPAGTQTQSESPDDGLLCRRIDRPTLNSDTFGIIQAPNETASDLQYRKICEHVPCTRRTSQKMNLN